MSFVAQITADISNFDKNVKKAVDITNDSVSKMQAKFDRLGDSFVKIGTKASILSAGLVAVGTKAFLMAADIEDAVGATEQIFGNNADSVNAWAGNLDASFGIAKKEALEYSNLMGSMLINIGKLTEEQASKQSAKLIELAGDLTAMYGGSTQDAVRALTGALKGNNTMLDNYGMAVNEALIKQKALELGLMGTSGEMTLQAKQGATLALIWEQTGAAQGQAAREADGSSGAMRALKTEITNLSTELGEVLLPIITPIVSGLRDFVSGIRDLSPEAKKMIVVVAGIASAVGPLLLGLGSLLKMLPLIKAGFIAIKIALAALSGPVGAIVLGLAALTAGIVYFTNRANEATTAADALATVNDKIASSLRKEKAELNQLLAAARDETKSKKYRLEAIQKLNKISPKHLGFITLETVNTKAAKNAVNDYTKAITENARQKAIASKIEELYIKQLELEEKIAVQEARKARAGKGSDIHRIADREIESIKKKLENVNASIKAYENLSDQQVKTGESGADATSEALDALKVFLSELDKVDKKTKEISIFDSLIGDGSDIYDLVRRTANEITVLTKNLEGLRSGAVEAENVKKEIEETEQKIKDLSSALDLLTGGRELNIKVNTDSALDIFRDTDFGKDAGLVVPIIPQIDTSLLKDGMGDLRAGLTEVAIDVSGMLTDLISGAFASLGEALVSGDNIMQSMGAALLGTFGGILVQLGEMVTELGVGMLVAKLALKSLNPYLAIAGGAALIAIGSAFASSSRKLSQSMGGGGYSSAPSMQNSQPTLGYSDYRGAYQDDFRVEFSIGNDALVATLDTAQQRRKRI